MKVVTRDVAFFFIRCLVVFYLLHNCDNCLLAEKVLSSKDAALRYTKKLKVLLKIFPYDTFNIFGEYDIYMNCDLKQRIFCIKVLLYCSL